MTNPVAKRMKLAHRPDGESTDTEPDATIDATIEAPKSSEEIIDDVYMHIEEDAVADVTDTIIEEAAEVDNTNGVNVVASFDATAVAAAAAAAANDVSLSEPMMPPLPSDGVVVDSHVEMNVNDPDDSGEPPVPPLGAPLPVQPRAIAPQGGRGRQPAHTLPSTDPSYRRKDKSLGVLCANFMRRYSKIKSEHPGTLPEVTIDEASQSLMVERRRIYDIINILEAIEVVTRKGKNTYNWFGMSNITHTLRKMQKEAIDLFPEDVIANDLKVKAVGPEIPTGFAMLLASAEQVDQTVKKGKDKSLGRLSQKFIQLFLVGNETITLEDASDKILGKTDLPQPAADATAEEMLKVRNANNKMIKTKIRRLYDIANIMASVGLIAKLNSENQHVGSAPRSRPMFKWIYPLSPLEILNSVDENAGDGTVVVNGGGKKVVKIGESGVVENTIPVDGQDRKLPASPSVIVHAHEAEMEVEVEIEMLANGGGDDEVEPEPLPEDTEVSVAI